MRGYPRHLVDHILSEVKFTERESALQHALCHPISPISASSEENINAKMALDREPTLTQGNMQGTPFHLLQKGETLKDILVRAKLQGSRYNTITRTRNCVWSVNILFISLKIKGPSFTQFSIYFLARFHEAFYVSTERISAP